MSPVHLAVLTKDLEMLEFLVNNYFNVNSVNTFGNTPLMEAMLADDKKENEVIVGRIIATLLGPYETDFNHQNNRGKSIAHLLAIKNRRGLLGKGVKYSFIPCFVVRNSLHRDWKYAEVVF